MLSPPILSEIHLVKVGGLRVAPIDEFVCWGPITWDTIVAGVIKNKILGL